LTNSAYVVSNKIDKFFYRKVVLPTLTFVSLAEAIAVAISLAPRYRALTVRSEIISELGKFPRTVQLAIVGCTKTPSSDFKIARFKITAFNYGSNRKRG
jgi:hypothetical protein